MNIIIKRKSLIGTASNDDKKGTSEVLREIILKKE